MEIGFRFYVGIIIQHEHLDQLMISSNDQAI